MVFLGQRLLIIFIELLFELFPLIEVVHHLHLLPGVPLVQHPVGGDGLTVVADTAGVILEDGGVIMLFSPALPGKLDITCALKKLVKTYFSPSSSICARILMSLMLLDSSNLALRTVALNLKCHLSKAQLSMVL